MSQGYRGGRGGRGGRGRGQQSGGQREFRDDGNRGYDRGHQSGAPTSRSSQGGGGQYFSKGGGDGPRGYQQHGFDNRGRGRSTTAVTFVPTNQVPSPFLSSEDFPKLKAKHGMGWRNFDETSSIQSYKGPTATTHKTKVKLSVNHFPLVNFQMPEKIYHYEVSFERIKVKKQETRAAKPSPQKGAGRAGSSSAEASSALKKLPRPYPQLILQYLISKINRERNYFGIISDLSNNIYSTKPLEDLKIDLKPVVKCSALDKTILQETDDGEVHVTIARTEKALDQNMIRAINEHLRSRGTWKGFELDAAVKTAVEQIYNAILKSFPSYRFLPVGRSNMVKWPDNNQDGEDLGMSVVCWKGIAANISMGWKPYLNIDLSHCAFMEEKYVIDACSALLSSRYQQFDARSFVNWKSWHFTEAKSLLKNVKVTYIPGKGKILAGPITDILPTAVGQTYFTLNGTKTSVHQYFKSEYDKEVNPNGICLQLRGRSQVPAEICKIKKGQSYNRKLNEMQTSSMLKSAKKNPDALHREIMTQLGELVLSGPTTDAWGVNINKKMLTFDARVLQPPKLIFGKGTQENQDKHATIIPADGSWDIFSSEFKFLFPQTVPTWGILVAGSCRGVDDRSIQAFKDALIRQSKSKGVTFQNEEPIVEYATDLRDDSANQKNNVNYLERIFKKSFSNCRIIFVVVPRKNCVIYSHVKQSAEIKVGLLTQCVIAANVERVQTATIQNILLKVNSKLGGKNYIVTPPTPNSGLVDFLDCPMLIIGADVTHPPPGSTRRIKVGKEYKEVKVPSFAAVTGSVDRTGMPFMMDVRAQVKSGRGAAEVIQNFNEIVYNMLLMFQQKTRGPKTPDGIRPRKIVYFRDGCGEGQFPEVLHTEMSAIRRACSELLDYDGEPYQPKITFVTVQKRHKTRFFLHGEGGRVVGNAPAGTVVDTEIVHQTENDFFLCSHKGMMGTSRPTRYHVLWDDSEFTADQIQNLTYYLCYMYIRCCKSVRIPAPTYYAHWGAARAKALSDGLDDLFDNIPNLNEALKRENSFATNFPMHFV